MSLESYVNEVHAGLSSGGGVCQEESAAKSTNYAPANRQAPVHNPVFKFLLYHYACRFICAFTYFRSCFGLSTCINNLAPI
jgi:hypothetical protein